MDSVPPLLSASAGVRAWPQPWPGRLVVVRGDAASRRAAAAALLQRLAADIPTLATWPTPPAREWPFTYPLTKGGPPDGTPVVVVENLHEAFENRQTNATRLVTTQPSFLLQSWLDTANPPSGAWFLATVDPAALATHAPDALEGRGPWREVHWVEADTDGNDASLLGAGRDAAASPSSATAVALATAFRLDDPAERLALAGRTLDERRDAVSLLALASVCMEVNDLENAGALLRDAVAAAPSWPAAHFERGKWHLRTDDMPGAAEAFGLASRLMPRFAAAAANAGAALGELDRADEALAAFRVALAAEPDSPQALNNVGVLLREMGRLADAEAAFRQAIALTPDLAFGHYNLGHTLFLQGRYQASLAAYQSGQKRDPARSPVQASRLAMARLGTGDAAGALRDLQSCLAALPADYRRQVLSDTQSVAWALLSASPDLRDWRLVGDWLAAQLARA